MPQTMTGKRSETIVSGRLKLAAFKYWLTKRKRWEKIGEESLCRGFCPACKYEYDCRYTLKRLEASDD